MITYQLSYFACQIRKCVIHQLEVISDAKEFREGHAPIRFGYSDGVRAPISMQLLRKPISPSWIDWLITFTHKYLYDDAL